MTLIALKATIAMLIVLLLMRLTRRASASFRHLIVATTFGVLLFLPIAVAVMPERVVSVPSPASGRGMPEGQGEGVSSTPQTLTRAPRYARRAALSRTRERVDWVAIASRGYVAGIAIFVATLIVGIWRVHQLHHNADVSVSATQLANEMARAEKIPCGIEVAISSELAVPITFGIGHPVILLPAETNGWSDSELGRAIRHELEHIARGDWTTQIMSRLACALYWPHPFVWVLWRRLRLEAERACDDAVIRSQGEPMTYAEQLVSLAKRLMGRATPALAMATRTNLGLRVESILDTSRRRNPLTRLGSFTIVIIAMATMLAVAPFRVMSAAVPDQRGESIEADPLDEALFKAAESGDVQRMNALMNRGAKANAVINGDGTPLMAAAKQGHLEAMRILIAAGADVDRGVEGDGNALIVAAKHGHMEAVRLLLDSGADIDAGVEGDGNPLIMASSAGQVAIVQYLLDRGAHIEEVVRGDENPLIHASEAGQAEVVRLLIDRGANLNARVRVERWTGGANEFEWRTPLSMARRNGHADVVKILLAAGASQ